MPDKPPLPSSNVFRHRDYALFWAKRFMATVGYQAESVAIGWQVYAVARRSRSVPEGAFLVGVVGLCQFLPTIALTLFAGDAADRHDRRRIVLTCLAVEIALVLVLAGLALHPQPSLLPIFVIAAGFGAARTFLSPALGAIGPMLVPREELPRAVAWSSLAWQSGSIIGPWIGGALVAISPSAAFGGAAALYAGAGVCVLSIRTDLRPRAVAGKRAAQIKEGLAYVWSNKIVFGSISLDLFAVLLGGATALLPVFARDVLHVGAGGFGVLRSGPAIGAGLVALALTRRPLQRRAGTWMFAGVAVFGAATILFGLSRSLWLSVLALAVLGGADAISVYVRNTLVQIVTPDAMRGRVSAVSGLFIGASNELGEFETGFVARLLGPVVACVAGGVASLAVTALWTQLFPQLRDADRLDAPET